MIESMFVGVQIYFVFKLQSTMDAVAGNSRDVCWSVAEAARNTKVKLAYELRISGWVARSWTQCNRLAQSYVDQKTQGPSAEKAT